jgi:hypothetical protein
MTLRELGMSLVLEAGERARMMSIHLQRANDNRSQSFVFQNSTCVHARQYLVYPCVHLPTTAEVSTPVGTHAGQGPSDHGSCRGSFQRRRDSMLHDTWHGRLARTWPCPVCPGSCDACPGRGGRFPFWRIMSSCVYGVPIAPPGPLGLCRRACVASHVLSTVQVSTARPSSLDGRSDAGPAAAGGASVCVRCVAGRGSPQASTSVDSRGTLGYRSGPCPLRVEVGAETRRFGNWFGMPSVRASRHGCHWHVARGPQT